MAKTYDDFYVDNRLVKLNISRGNITNNEYDDFIKSLPDLAEQADEIPAYQEPEEGTNSSGELTFSVA